jgi:hypothetical protein
MIPDSRLFEAWPNPPEKEGEILSWARRLMYKLTAERTELYNVFTTAYASAIEFSPSFSNILKFTTVHATGNCTVTARTGKIGPVWLVITNDATSGKVITFGAGFSSAGTLTGTASKTAVLMFISDGETLWEVSRKENL